MLWLEADSSTITLLEPRARPFGGPWVVVVAADQPPLYEYLRKSLAPDPAARVVLDRRRRDRRRRLEAHALDRRRGERRRLTDYARDLRFHWVAVCREQWSAPRVGDLGVSEPQEGGRVRMGMTDTGASEVRQQVERWIEESQGLLGRIIPSLLDDNQRLRDKVVGAEQDCDRMREEIGVLRREVSALQAELETLRGQHDYLKGEQLAVADALTRAVHHLSQLVHPINEMAAKLHIGQPALEGSLP